MKYLLSSLFIGLSRIVIYYWPYPIKTTDIYRVNLLYVSPNRYAYISYYSDMIMFWVHIDHIPSKTMLFFVFSNNSREWFGSFVHFNSISPYIFSHSLMYLKISRTQPSLCLGNFLNLTLHFSFLSFEKRTVWSCFQNGLLNNFFLFGYQIFKVKSVSFSETDFLPSSLFILSFYLYVEEYLLSSSDNLSLSLCCSCIYIRGSSQT